MLKSVRDSQIPVRDSWIPVTKIKGSVVKRGWIKGLCPRIPLKNLYGIPILLLTPRLKWPRACPAALSALLPLRDRRYFFPKAVPEFQG